MSDDPIAFVRDEIRFFMDRSFQVSYGYIGALLGLAASAHSDFAHGLAMGSGTSVGSIVALAVLILNGIYLTVGMSCSFAVLKRAYFILRFTAPDNGTQLRMYLAWERFVRQPPPRRSTLARLRPVVWNIDNYYMTPVFVTVLSLSVCAAFYSWHEERVGWMRQASVVVCIISLVVFVILALAVRHLDCSCRKHLDGLRD